MSKRLAISTRSKRPVLTITRTAIKHKRLVYIAVANKEIKYKNGKSPIVYIGTTKKGISRIASSAATRAQKILGEHGFKELNFYIIYSKSGRQKLEAVWEKLERTLIQAFKDRFYEPPRLNKQGSKKDWSENYKIFSKNRAKKIIESFSL